MPNISTIGACGIIPGVVGGTGFNFQQITIIVLLSVFYYASMF
jgi:hypothetical protein